MIIFSKYKGVGIIKKIISILCLVIMLLCTACASAGQQFLSGFDNHQFPVTEEDSMKSVKDNFESIFKSYYSYNETDAYRLIKSNALKRFLNQWTDDDIVNPVWNYESFTKYEGQDLFYCTFTADNGKYYYMVLRYDGRNNGGLGKIRYSETPYYYDLKSSIDEIKDKLSETELDLSSTVASRAQLVDIDKNSFDEVILFKDDDGNSYACYLETFKIVKM